MQNSTFKIYNASAGSGKTFTLAKSYLKILISAESPDKFKSILAITFTNKAVGEMKTRIIEMLKTFSSDQSLSLPHPMFSAICDELKISPNQLITKSKIILKHILHNYGAFNISTIDGFTHRVIRTFAKDLKLPVNFEVELDQDRLLNEAVDGLIAKAGTDKKLTKVLVDFAIEKADDDKSWDISYDFSKIAKLLISEADLPFTKKLKDKSLDDFKKLKLHLSKEISIIESKIKTISETVLKLIEESGLQFDDFNRKSLPNYFIKLAEINFSIGFEANWQDDLVNGNALYPKRVSKSIAETIDSIQPQLASAFTSTKKMFFDLRLKKAFYKNITPVSVLNAIQTELYLLKEEQNKMLISEFNTIIHEEIKNQPTPFIYERLGEKFKNYFIDEFQDTSKMQWDNLVPLLDNALSGPNGSVMLVGDAKQAIYRWRGGEAEQFINLYNKHTNPFQTEKEIFALETNYRSAKAVVEFNNSLFKFLGQNFIGNPNYAELFENAMQHTNSESLGYVNLNFLDLQEKDDNAEPYVTETMQTVLKCKENGYPLSDICILVRKRKEGVAIAQNLSENGIKITSSETLLLKNSEKVNFLNIFLKLLLQPNNDVLQVEFLSFLAEQNHITDSHNFFTTHLKREFKATLKSLETIDIHLNINELLQLPLYELLEKLVRTFNMNDHSDAFLQFYMDVVLEFAQKNDSDLVGFISYFEKNEDRLSVVSPKNLDAVQIMTIHKAKGLEFPVVIFPFADLNIYQEIEPKVWFPMDNSEVGFESFLINYSKDVEHFGDAGKMIFDTHQSELELDNLNLLYVVLTRAVEQLYIISKKDLNSKGKLNENSYAGMLISYLQHRDLWDENQPIYEFGTLIKPQTINNITEESESIGFISTAKEEHNFSIVTRSGLLWDTHQEQAIERGNLVHLVLSKIRTVGDLDFELENLLTLGEISHNQLNDLKQTVAAVVSHPKLSPYFQDRLQIYNEHDIITSTGQLLRPDRLVITTNNEAVIIDYKTGEPKLNHGTQLGAYEKVITQMGFAVSKKLLVYINEDIEIIEV
ncbi:UvrD-helicase domain-containing protein [Winogradskyella ursingii]|uniref:UvrD-helicase domain-containing protein n=1 Tax=Winogradskyella ursingii TaxID=2686079 RepID=UPI0015CDAFF2|nr:UvrD-helicase domain-containing protein [Winogradskyella ursingii]